MLAHEAKITVIVDGKQQKVKIGPIEIKMQKGVIIEEKYDIVDFIEEKESVFETVKAKLIALAQQHEFNHKEIFDFLSMNPSIRVKHLEAYLRQPRFVAQMIHNILLDSRACHLYNGVLRKDEEFAKYINGSIGHRTVRSLSTIEKERYKYTIPTDEDLSMMSVEMIDEEIRVCEKARYKYQKEDLETLRNARSERIRETRLEKQAVARKKNTNSELQQFIDAAEEIVGNKKPRKEKE